MVRVPAIGATTVKQGAMGVNMRWRRRMEALRCEGTAGDQNLIKQSPMTTMAVRSPAVSGGMGSQII